MTVLLERIAEEACFEHLDSYHTSVPLVTNASLMIQVYDRREAYNAHSKAFPLSKYTPSRTPISQHQPSPRPSLSNLNHRLPRSRQSTVFLSVRPRRMLLLPRQTDDLLTGRLNSEFSRLLLCERHGLA